MSECLLCGGPLGDPAFPYSTRYAGNLYTYRSCNRCGSSTLDPLPTADDLRLMYARNSYHAEHYAENDDQVTDSRFIEIIPLLGERRHRLLDFGCGNGDFLKFGARFGFETTGAELDREACVAASAHSGRPVLLHSDLSACGLHFDIIRLGDVLEHLPDPAATMRQLTDLLAPDGLFVLEGPIEANAGIVRWASVGVAACFLRLRPRPEGSFPPFHLFQANRQAQMQFLRDRLGHDVRYFDVWETGWPYRQTPVPRSLGGLTRDIIGRAAIAVAALTRPLRLGLGNRFIAVTAPR